MKQAPLIPFVQVRLVAEVVGAYSRKGISGSDGAYGVFMEAMKGTDREEFWVMALNAKHKPIHLERVSVGSLHTSIVHPREVLKGLILANAAAFIVAHNHPSGDPKPSPEDEALTKRIKAAGELIGIVLLDHLVIGDEKFYSFADENLL